MARNPRSGGQKLLGRRRSAARQPRESGNIRAVNPELLLTELLRIASSIGLEIRSVGLRRKQSGPGGLCTINGHPVVILNARMSVMDRGTALADAIVGRDLSGLDMPAEVRVFLDARTRSRSRLLLPQRGPGPGLARCLSEPERRRSREP